MARGDLGATAVLLVGFLFLVFCVQLARRPVDITRWLVRLAWSRPELRHALSDAALNRERALYLGAVSAAWIMAGALALLRVG